MQDGQNLFDPATSFIPGMYWNMGETAGRLIADGSIRPLIIVGIYNGKQRIREYTPTPDKKLGGGGADRYARAVLEDIKPFIESDTARLRDRRTLAWADRRSARFSRCISACARQMSLAGLPCSRLRCGGISARS